jgi:sterol desaturase/sphingolipid hydroxylase (fatty acid hydroxylase superfamily)
MQSDQYHYLHHRFFECNYGTGAVPFDKWFGTFRDSLDLKSSTSYKGEHVASAENKMDAASAGQADAKSTLMGMPSWDQLTFNLVTYVACPLLVFSAAGIGPFSKEMLGPLCNPYLVALLMSVGPSIMGMILIAVTSRRPFARPAYTFLYPFHKEKWFGAFGINVLLSLCLTVLPVYQMVYMFVSEPGQGVYFSLWGK